MTDSCYEGEPCTTLGVGVEVDIVYVEATSAPMVYEVRPETISTADYHQGQ